MKKKIIISLLLVFMIFAVFVFCSVRSEAKKICAVKGCYKETVRGGNYCFAHTCTKSGCTKRRDGYSSYCSIHKIKTNHKGYSNKKSSKKKYDQYDVYSYKNAQDFADDKYEEFYDYEDDYEDEDEAYDAAWDYWDEHN